MDLRALDALLVENKDEVQAFLGFHRRHITCPIYASVDIRRSGFKAAVVDANAFPAGFNNLAVRSRNAAMKGLRSHVDKHYPGVKEVLVLAEGHTRNRGYFENLRTLEVMFKEAGFGVRLGTLNEELFPNARVESLAGEVEIHGVRREQDALVADGVAADLVVLNHDLSEGQPAILAGLGRPVTPPASMGWHRRRKVDHFRLTNDLLEQLASKVGFDPWLLGTIMEPVVDVDFKAKEGLQEVADGVDRVVAAVASKYEEHGITRTPSAFVKADPGTYGMGITTATSGKEFLALNSKGRARMDRGKGKVKTQSVIVQEGVPTDVRAAKGVAEPVMYIVCGRVIGGFNRIHGEKSDTESLNAPGASFEPIAFCLDDEAPGPDETPLDGTSCRVYELLGEVAAIVTGYELKLQAGGSVPSYS